MGREIRQSGDWLPVRRSLETTPSKVGTLRAVGNDGKKIFNRFMNYYV